MVVYFAHNLILDLSGEVGATPTLTRNRERDNRVSRITNWSLHLYLPSWFTGRRNFRRRGPFHFERLTC